MDKLNQVRDKTSEFHGLVREIVSNACHGALLAKGFVPDERLVEELKGWLTTLFSSYLNNLLTDQRRKRQQKASYIEQASKKKFCERLSA